MEFEDLIYEKSNHIATITLHNPEKLNAMTGRMLASFSRAIELVRNDDDVRVLVLTGEGAGPGDTWRVDVSKSDTNWHANFHLFVQRTSNGSGNPNNISGGTTYQEVTGTDQSFFNGERKDRT